MKSHTEISNHGFTLIELLVAMAISGIVMAGVYSVYYTQQKSSTAQEQISAMQQNLRAGMYFMMREISMAGCDPPTPGVQPPAGDAGAGIVTANNNSIRFTMDITNTAGTSNQDDGLLDGPNEDITYSLYDFGGDGDTDLGRNTGGGNQPVAENIDALNFVYIDAAGVPLDDDGSGNVVASIPAIRSVEITLVARTGRGDPGYTNNAVFRNQRGAVIYTAPGDNLRRKSLTCEIRCRNLGL